jgi:hypothetical protein
MYIADQTQAPAGSEMLGQSIADWTDNLAQHITDPVFHKYDLIEINPENWYSLDIVVDLYQEIKQSDGGGTALTAMGKASAGPVQQACNFSSFKDFLSNAGEPFKVAIRNIPEEYGLLVEEVGERHYKITNNSIVPNSMIYGYLWEMLRIINQGRYDYTFKPAGGFDIEAPVRGVFDLQWR